MVSTEWGSRTSQHPDADPGGLRNGTRMAGGQVQEKSFDTGGTDYRNVCSSYTRGETEVIIIQHYLQQYVVMYIFVHVFVCVLALTTDSHC